MRKFLQTLMLAAAMLLPLASQAQTTVEIGDPASTTTQYTLPVNMYYHYSLTQQIFTSDEIGMSGSITAISFEYTNSGTFTMDSVRLYMKNVSRDNFASTTDMESISSSDLVWEGTFTANAAGWVTITLTTPFSYDVNDNLLVCFYDNQNGYPGSAFKFRTSSTTTDFPGEYLAMAYYSDSDIPDLSDVSTFSGSKTRYQYRDNVEIDIIPSGGSICAKPATLVASNITSDAATLTWASTTAGNYQFEYKANADTVWTEIPLTDTTYSLSNLVANTVYDVRVKAICGVDDESGYRNGTFRTDCSVEAFPFTETFDATINNDPCWSGATGTTAAQVFAGTALTLTTPQWTYSNSVSNGLAAGHYRVNIYGASCKKWMITPAIDLSTASSAQLSFDAVFTAYSGTGAPTTPGYDTNTSQAFMVIVSADGGNTWLETNATNISLASIAGTSYATQVINLNQFVGDTIKIAFYAQSLWTGGDNNLHIDNIAVTEAALCSLVQGVSVDSVMGTTAYVSWNNANVDGYQWQLLQNDTVVTGYVFNTADTFAVINNLVIDNDYQFEVRSICGNDFGQWTSPVNIHIGYCLPDPTSVDGNGITSVSFGGMTNTTHPTSAGYANYASMSGSVPAGTTASVDITYATGYTYGTIIWVDWNSSMSFESDEVVYRGTSENTNPTTLTATFDIPATQALGDYRMRILGADSYFDSYVTDPTSTPDPCASYTWGVAEDYTLTVAVAPSCLAVTDLAVDSVSQTSVSLSWTGTAASYDIYNGTTYVTSVSTNAYTVTGLTTATVYTFGVQAICSATDTAAMVTIAAMTACGDITTLPYVESFESGSLGCWTTVNGSTDGVAWFATDCAGLSNVTPHGGNYVASSWSWNNSAMHANAWMISPKFILPTSADSLILSWWEITNPNYADSYSVEISTTTNDTTAFTVVRPSTAAAGTWTMQTIDLSSYAGQSIYIAFHHVDYDENYLLIDDITLSNGTPVVEPDSVHITFAVNDPTMGTINPAPGTYAFVENTGFSVTAIPATGYQLLDWTATLTYMGQTMTYSTGISDLTFTDTAYAEYELYDLVLTAVFGIDSVTPGNDSVHITFAVNDPTMGTTNPAPGTYAYVENSPFSVTAIPATGYQLLDWTVTMTYMGQAYTYSMETNDLTISDTAYAEFELYNLVVTAVFGSDSIVPGNDSMLVNVAVNDPTMGTTIPAPGAHYFYVGEDASVVAVPNNGYHLEGWSILVSNTGYGVVMDTTLNYPVEDVFDLFGGWEVEEGDGAYVWSVTANFAAGTAPETHDSLTVITAVNNAAWGTAYPAVGTHYYVEGDEVVVGAVPNAGYYLYAVYEIVTIPGYGTINDTLFAEDLEIEPGEALFDTLEVDEDYMGVTFDFRFVFAPIGVDSAWLTVTVNNTLMGTTNPEPGMYHVHIGESMTFTAVPYDGYVFSSWSNGATTATVTVTVESDMTLTATFVPTQGIDDVETVNVNVYGKDGNIVLKGAEGREVFVFDINGRMMHHTATATETELYSVPASGAYLLRIEGIGTKRVVVVR